MGGSNEKDKYLAGAYEKADTLNVNKETLGNSLFKEATKR